MSPPIMYVGTVHSEERGPTLVRLAYGFERDVALWSSCKLRKPNRCAVTDADLPVGTEVFRPVGNQMYRYVRIEAVVLRAIIAHMEAEEANMPDEIPPLPNGYECVECSAVVADDSMDTMAHPPDCENCGADVTGFVRIEPCSNGEGCEDDYHHYGRGDHVVTLPT